MPNTEPDLAPRLDVVAAIIRDDAGRVLLARRPQHKHQGGRWEFPGGKVEPGEALQHALQRELDEELGLFSLSCRPFMTVDHHYPDLHVRLHFREVSDWHGEPHGREGQAVAWFEVAELGKLEFPAANRPIVKALQLSDQLLILPESLAPDWSARLAAAIASGVGLVYLRGLEKAPQFLRQAVELCHQAGALALLRNDLSLLSRCGADGLHLSADVAATLTQRPDVGLLSVACHNEEELEIAGRLRADMVTLSPVCHSASHPDAEPLGWQEFARLAVGRPFAVYALGGINKEDLELARGHGARGVAGIRDFFR
ncbi:MAG: Nudix family hydrolase [Alcanivoracaceae bacterium]|jgi:8-oxo-dGTP diphosphatase|nr:Nudix family hydrolase [Alcanivoracaceae bacterium]